MATFLVIVSIAFVGFLAFEMVDSVKRVFKRDNLCSNLYIVFMVPPVIAYQMWNVGMMLVETLP
jgi:hypothetical protein